MAWAGMGRQWTSATLRGERARGNHRTAGTGRGVACCSARCKISIHMDWKRTPPGHRAKPREAHAGRVFFEDAPRWSRGVPCDGRQNRKNGEEGGGAVAGAAEDSVERGSCAGREVGGPRPGKRGRGRICVQRLGSSLAVTELNLGRGGRATARAGCAGRGGAGRGRAEAGSGSGVCGRGAAALALERGKESLRAAEGARRGAAAEAPGPQPDGSQTSGREQK